MNEIQYPTDEELERMYEEYVKSGSFEEIFDIQEIPDNEFPFQSYNIINKNNLSTGREDRLPRDFFYV